MADKLDSYSLHYSGSVTVTLQDDVLTLLDHPIHVLVLYVFGIGLLFTVFNRRCAQFFEAREAESLDSDIPLQHFLSSASDEDASRVKHPNESSKRLWFGQVYYLIISMIIAIIWRIELLRQMLKAPECSINGYEVKFTAVSPRDPD